MTLVIEKGKPIVLPNGSTVLPGSNGLGSTVISAEKKAEEAEHDRLTRELQSLLDDPFSNDHTTTVRRSLADISVDFNHMNVVMLVLSYSTWGLDDSAIARILNVETSYIERLQTSDIFVQTKEEFIDALKHAEAATVHGFIQSKSQAAATVMVNALTSRKEENRLAAAKDLLDRGGFRPTDRVEHSIRFEDELRIRYVEDSGKTPLIDISLGE